MNKLLLALCIAGSCNALDMKQTEENNKKWIENEREYFRKNTRGGKLPGVVIPDRSNIKPMPYYPDRPGIKFPIPYDKSKIVPC